ncbi:unnamed protein product [Amoebophrya sp. A25]|nr:unnamed protein product [Amoebophrya sp. A25]|eukprot:GSA25T00001370001.1
MPSSCPDCLLAREHIVELESCVAKREQLLAKAREKITQLLGKIKERDAAIREREGIIRDLQSGREGLGVPGVQNRRGEGGLRVGHRGPLGTESYTDASGCSPEDVAATASSPEEPKDKAVRRSSEMKQLVQEFLGKADALATDIERLQIEQKRREAEFSQIPRSQQLHDHASQEAHYASQSALAALIMEKKKFLANYRHQAEKLERKWLKACGGAVGLGGGGATSSSSSCVRSRSSTTTSNLAEQKSAGVDVDRHDHSGATSEQKAAPSCTTFGPEAEKRSLPPSPERPRDGLDEKETFQSPPNGYHRDHKEEEDEDVFNGSFTNDTAIFNSSGGSKSSSPFQDADSSGGGLLESSQSFSGSLVDRNRTADAPDDGTNALDGIEGERSPIPPAAPD